MLLLLLIDIICKIINLMMIIIVGEIRSGIVKLIFFAVQSLEIARAEIIIIPAEIFLIFVLAAYQ